MISRGLVAGDSCRQIARQLRRAASTVSREVARNGGRGQYRACQAERAAFKRARRPKATKLGSFPQLRHAVEALLQLRWSPQQIAGWLAHACRDREFRVSHETIYLSMFIQPRGTLRKQLTQYLRSRRKVRSPRTPHTVNGQGQLRDAVHISERPVEAEDRAVPGHWEGDLLLGKGNSAIATLVERSTRFAVLVRLTCPPETRPPLMRVLWPTKVGGGGQDGEGTQAHAGADRAEAARGGAAAR